MLCRSNRGKQRLDMILKKQMFFRSEAKGIA